MPRGGQCSRWGCKKPHKARGLCSKHYKDWSLGYIEEEAAVKRNNVEPDWPYDFQNINGVWHRSPAGLKEWKRVVWDAQADDDGTLRRL